MRRIFATWTLLLIAAAWSFAQLPPSMSALNVEYNPLLLMNASVHQELKLSQTDSQKVQSAVMDEFMKLLPVITTAPNGKTPASPEQRTKAVLTGLTKMQGRIAALLTPAQRTRLRQLTLQSIGPSAVVQPRVANQLGLSQAQRSKLAVSISNANEAIARQLPRGGSPDKMRTQLVAMNKLQAQAKAQANKALMATLTAPQKAKWSAMLGKPFPLSGFLGSGGLMPGM